MNLAKVVKMKVLSVDVLKENLHYEPTTGIFTWIKRHSGTKIGSIAGGLDKNGYIRISINASRYQAHRLAWLYMTGTMPTDLIDHKNGVKSDNWFDNLRESSHQQNMHNQINPTKGSRVGLLGVSFDKSSNKFMSQIVVNGKNKHLGRFVAAEEAHEAYLKAKKEFHPFSNL